MNYKEVLKSTKGSNYYGNSAHTKSIAQFKKENGRKPTVLDIQALRDMAEKRQNHYIKMSNIDTHIDDL